MIQPPIFRFTEHLRHRFYERIKKEDWKGFSKYDSEIKRFFHEAVENKKWVNNTWMVDHLREKYGTTKIKIFHNKTEDIIFICRRDDSISNLYFIVTCFKNSKESMYTA